MYDLSYLEEEARLKMQSRNQVLSALAMQAANAETKQNGNAPVNTEKFIKEIENIDIESVQNPSKN